MEQTTTFCLSYLNFNGGGLILSPFPYSSAVWCPNSFHRDLLTIKRSFSEYFKCILWDREPGGGGLGSCTYVQFFYQLQQMLDICRLNIHLFGHLWTPNSHVTWQSSFLWSTSVNCALQSYSTRTSLLARGGALSRCQSQDATRKKRNSLEMREILFPWVQVEKANNWWAVNNHGKLSFLYRNLIQKEVKSQCKYLCICNFGDLPRVWDVSIENVNGLLYWVLIEEAFRILLLKLNQLIFIRAPLILRQLQCLPLSL